MTKVKLLIFITIGLLPLGDYTAFSQDLNITRTSSPITIDGHMDEKAWQAAEMTTGFRQHFPYDSSLAVAQTEVRMLYDDDNIYVIAKMLNLGPREYVAQSLKRDYRGGAFDGFTVVLDTYKDRTNAFVFGVNPYGVQREGLITNGGDVGRGVNAFTLNWDNKWYAEATMHDGYWIAEMAIPFKTLRFKSDLDSWFVNFYRVDSEYAERSTLAPIPRNFRLVSLAFNGQLNWDQPLKNPGKNISLIPYTSFGTSKDYENDSPSNTEFNAGGDAKVALSSSLNLDLTINPDFSQVETDQQVTNLDRFEIFFPERRQFFLENDDLFSSFGRSGARPFFSRRMGVARDTATGTNVQNPLYGGARLTGNINNLWRVGLLTIQADEEKDLFIPSTNYTAATVQRRIGPRSNIAALFVNKQAFQDTLGSELTSSPQNWNRTFALDANLATADNRWATKAYYHRSFDQDGLDSTYSAGIGLRYQTYKWEADVDYRNMGANFNPEVGFVQRRDFQKYRGTIYNNYYPKAGKIQSHAPGFDYDFVWNNTYGLMDWDLNLLYRINFRNTSRFSLRLRRQFTYLFDPFDPSGTDGLELAADTEYYYNFIIGNFQSDQRHRFFYEVSTRSGEYFNGTRINLEGTLSYRFLLKGVLALNFEYNRIRLPGELSDADLILVGPRLELTFTKNIFWTTFVQYNEQINNVNLNTRFQWRFKPVSDLFIVYTDNYLAAEDGVVVDFGQPKSRALVVKLTYWLNL